jgi:type IV pilus assembly protein PilF
MKKMRYSTAFFALVFTCLFLFGCAEDTAIKKKQAEATRKVGEAYLRKKSYHLAYREFMKAKELYPDDANLHFDLGLFFMEKKRPLKAIESFKRAIALNPDFPSARNNLGVVYLQLKEWDKAIAVLSEVVEDEYVYTTPHYSFFLLGRAYYEKKQFPQAIKYFRRALEEQPDYVYAAVWLGRIHLMAGRVAEAIKVLEEARDTAPEFADSYYWLAHAYQRLYDGQKALEAYKKVLELAPDSKLAEKTRTEMALMKGKTDAQ